MNFVKTLSTLLTNNLTPTQSCQQVRNKWVNRWMIRDAKRRKLIVDLAPERLRVNSLRRNNIVPPELKEIADAEIQAMPTNSALNRRTNRCVITSRPRGVVHRWRVSRIVFRHLADYNKMAGIQRAMW